MLRSRDSYTFTAARMDLMRLADKRSQLQQASQKQVNVAVVGVVATGGGRGGGGGGGGGGGAVAASVIAAALGGVVAVGGAIRAKGVGNRR